MRHALITAGAKGLGRKVTELLLERGYSVTVNYRSDETAVQSLQQKYAHLDERLQFVRGDVTKKKIYLPLWMRRLIGSDALIF